MSLNLIQGYSSTEEENEQDPQAQYYQNTSDDDEHEDDEREHHSFSYKPLSQEPNPSSALPSAFHAFSQVSGPPQFLNNSVEVYGVPSTETEQQQGRHSGGRWRNSHRKEKKDKSLPAGAVVEAKPQLVGIHERVRSDIEGSQHPATSVLGTTQEGGKRVPTASNPNAEDAAELLRMCLQCGIPKTYSSARGMICPVCGDRPPSDASLESKKKGSTIKDKEKSKRMKGQSSHAAWKSETEMQLRQQFD